MQQLSPEQIDPNPYQPRKNFPQAELDQLAHSLKSNGLLQPIVVRAVGERWQLIAGERRLRAAKLAGIEKIPALIREVDDHELRLLALVENIQRSDLDPIEKAKAFVELKEKSGLTVQSLAAEVGLERSTVSNYIRLLELPSSVQERVIRRELSMGHARAILSAKREEQARLAAFVAQAGLSVRETERLAREGLEAPAATQTSERPSRAPAQRESWALDMEERLHQALGCKTRVEFSDGKGSIQLQIRSREEFDRVYELLLDVATS